MLAILLDHRQQPDNVGMIERLQRLAFPNEAVDQGRVVGYDFAFKQLDGDNLSSLAILSAIDCAHAALADEFADLETPRDDLAHIHSRKQSFLFLAWILLILHPFHGSL